MNHATIGHETPRQMYDAFQADERAHVLGFFDYCLFSQKKGMLLDALREGRWRDFAAGYNGAGRATEYGHQIESAAENAAAVLATRPAVAQGLDVTLGDQSVDVQFAVPLIPQPDKLSCWAGSMAMLVSYYRQASLTPESLAAQVSRSLRTSYGWDMLTSVRQHFLFKEVALPSNLSFVPPPSDWCHWLQQFGPLWITVVGNPSHAVVVAGISGDLTPSGTFIRVLNPWDDRAAFDGDPVDFHPPNTGHEETYSFADFSSMFGNMGLSDYGDWRVLYLGRRDVAPAEAQGVDLIDLSPEEIADAEPSGPPAAEANAVQAMTLARALGASDVRWAADDRSIDYRHLGAPGMSSQFILTPAILEQLCALNRFDVSAGQDEVLFGMRGCEVTGAPPAGFTASVTLSETIPDHTGARCLLGVWKRSAGQFRIFPASTVPNWTLMERFRQGGKRANLLPTGAVPVQSRRPPRRHDGGSPRRLSRGRVDGHPAHAGRPRVHDWRYLGQRRRGRQHPPGASRRAADRALLLLGRLSDRAGQREERTTHGHVGRVPCRRRTEREQPGERERPPLRVRADHRPRRAAGRGARPGRLARPIALRVEWHRRQRDPIAAARRGSSPRGGDGRVRRAD